MPNFAPAPEVPDSQREVVAFLSDRAFGTTRRIDTHAACLFLTDDRAWKLKKAVDLGYLDFSTPDKRRTALDAELRLNRRTAPDLYIAVHPLTRDVHGGLILDGDGDAVDWVLEMRRFADGALLDEHAAAGRLEQPLLLALAGAVAAFHDRAPAVAGWDSVGALRRVIDGNAEQLARLAGSLPAEACRPLIQRQRDTLGALAPLLTHRAEAGRVRRVHGDLHLGNVALIDGEPVPFDCLEFDETLATIDVLYDLAFLLMDLWHRGLRTEANTVANRYLDLSGIDEAGAALLPLFVSVRATIRAHIAGTRAAQGDAEALDPAHAYLDLAVAALERHPPQLVAIGGLSGTGKSTLARALGGSFGAVPGARILRSDVLRKRSCGMRPEQRLPRSSYTPAAADASYDVLTQLAAAHLAAGTAVIADAAFQEGTRRDAIAAIARAAGVPFAGLWLQAERGVRVERVRTRQADASDADVAVAQAQREVRPAEGEPWRIVSSAGQPADCLARARAALKL